MRKLLLLNFLLISIFAAAQEKIPTCKTDEMQKQLLENNKEYKALYEQTKAYLKEQHINNYKTVVTGSGTEYHVPVVVHVMHTGGAVGTTYNPSDVAIANFITHLNDGFSNNNDVPTVAGTYNSVAMPIKFYLAQRDELNSCSATTGINRIDMTGNATYMADGVGTPGVTDLSIKSIVHWNDLEYYNIYLVYKIDGENTANASGTYTLGYAYYPVLGGFKQDGMIVLTDRVTLTENTFIHEMGHGFDLAHPFEGGDASNCPPVTAGGCTVDNDEVCDTDPIRLNFTCNPSGSNPCGGLWSSSTTQFNYMAYNGCTDRFTAGQGVRINDALNFVRTGYKNTAGVDAPPSSLPANITAPTFGATHLNNNNNMGPTYVSLNAIEYTSKGYTSDGGGYKHYVDHTCNQATTLIKNTNYPITVKTVSNAQNVVVYIDYNNDGTFGTSAPELVFSSQVSSNINYSHIGSFTVPTTGVVMNTPLRMRVMADFISSTMSPTMVLNYGQAEDYTITILGAPLPVTWRNFSVQLIENNFVDIKWSTDMELNNDYFEVEHSRDGYNFSAIEKVEGNENKYTPSFYSFIDKSANVGNNYYRIKQTDKDGKTSFTKTEIVTIAEPKFTATIFPNPVNNDMNLTFDLLEKSYLEYSIIDLNGRVMLSNKLVANKGANTISINTQSIATGLYILKLKTNQGSLVKRIVKE